MSIKHFVATGFMTIFATAVAMAGCGVSSDSNAEGNEASGHTQPVAVTVDCQANSPNGYAGPNYSNAIAATETTVIDAIANQNTVYDITGYCAAAINARRRTPHTRTQGGVTYNMQPYYNLYDAAVVPAYSPIGINVSATSGSSVCRLCKGLADAAIGNHARYGACYGIAPDATGPTTNDNSEGFCGVNIGWTAKTAVDSCLNSFENELGLGHKGPIVWDSSRGISCVIGVYVDPTTGAKRAGITLRYSWPTRNAAQPNGGNCKVSGECLSGRCNGTKGRCEGFASTIRWNGSTVTAGVSTCPAADSRNCTANPGDPAICFSKNLACASDVCSNGRCAPGGTGKACVTNADCTSGVCTTAKTCQ